MSLDIILRILASIIIIGALILIVLPGIFWTAARIIFQLIILVVWGFVGYLLIKALEAVWKNKKGGKK